MTAVYLVLGLPGAGRQEVLAHLIEGGLPESPTVTIYHGPDEPAEPTLAARAGVKFVPHTFDKDHFVIAEDAEPDEEQDAVFFLTNGRISVIDQIEAFPAWLQRRDWELARILLVMDCTLAMAQPKVVEWHEACIHFTDVVLLNRRNALNHTWAQQFQKKFHGVSPCLFAMVKNGRVDNPLLVLYPEPRRLSLIFDDIDPIDALDLDEENLPEEPFNLENKPDPYFERLPSGHRIKYVPDVAEFLPK